MRWGWMTAFVVGSGLAAPALRADELRPPRNVTAEPATRQSSQLTSRAAAADIQGRPQQALELANQAIRADPRNPWPYYNKGMALAAMGETDGALAALFAAERHFAPTDRWARSVAIYGRTHTLRQAGRCVEAVQAFADYATFVGKDDPRAAQMARAYAVNCQQAPVTTAQSTQPAPVQPPAASAAPMTAPPPAPGPVLPSARPER
jgi:tetratricopeptide (TPR) repeat protein